MVGLPFHGPSRFHFPVHLFRYRRLSGTCTDLYHAKSAPSEHRCRVCVHTRYVQITVVLQRVVELDVRREGLTQEPHHPSTSRKHTSHHTFAYRVPAVNAIDWQLPHQDRPRVTQRLKCRSLPTADNARSREADVVQGSLSLPISVCCARPCFHPPITAEAGGERGTDGGGGGAHARAVGCVFSFSSSVRFMRLQTVGHLKRPAKEVGGTGGY